MAISVIENIKKAKKEGKKLLAVLLDPDKLDLETITIHIKELNKSNADYIFVGGSKVDNGLTDTFVTVIKKQSKIPIVLFPGDYRQISPNADAILFLSLLSGRNPEYLIEQQVQSIPSLMHLKLEIIPTGYILIDGGTITSTQKVSNTLPIPQNRIELIRNTSLAAEFLGKQLVYLEAGSGAKQHVSTDIIKTVSTACSVPVIVGGGLKTKKDIDKAYENGADLIVIGTAFENDKTILKELMS